MAIGNIMSGAASDPPYPPITSRLSSLAGKMLLRGLLGMVVCATVMPTLGVEIALFNKASLLYSDGSVEGTAKY